MLFRYDDSYDDIGDTVIVNDPDSKAFGFIIGKTDYTQTGYIDEEGFVDDYYKLFQYKLYIHKPGDLLGDIIKVFGTPKKSDILLTEINYSK